MIYIALKQKVKTILYKGKEFGKKISRNVVPVSIYLRYYEKKESDYLNELFHRPDTPQRYLDNLERVKKDYIKSIRKYGMPIRYYNALGFYEKNADQRDSYVGPGRLFILWNTINRHPSREMLDDKVSYMTKFEKYINREWLDMEHTSYEQFLEFCSCHKKMIVKNSKGYGGKGTHIFEYGQENETELHNRYLKYVEQRSVVEEYINQTGILHDINPDSVNCLRVCTMRHKDGVEIFQCFATMGNGNVCVDNAYEGGLFAAIDIESGMIKTAAYDADWNEFYKHPVTGVEIKGIQIPYWNQVKEFVTKAANELKDLIYISWDVAVCDDGEIYLIEGNSCGDTMWLEDGGEWERFEQVLKEYRLRVKYRIIYDYMVKNHTSELISY